MPLAESPLNGGLPVADISAAYLPRSPVPRPLPQCAAPPTHQHGPTTRGHPRILTTQHSVHVSAVLTWRLTSSQQEPDDEAPQRLEPMCAAPDPRTDSNWACLRTPPFVSVAQIEKPASSFRPGRAGRVLRPPLVRSPPDSPIEPWSAILNADLFALRFPSEAT